MRIDIVTIFPDYLTPLSLSLVGKARAAGVLDIRVHDLRDHATDKHRTVDDTPYGGGAGMVMKPDVWGAALDALIVSAGGNGGDDLDTASPHLLIPSPSGRVFDQAMAVELADDLVAGGRLAFACGRYEGIDARVAEDAAGRMRVTEVSIGDYVLNGGEAAALVIIEAVARLLPGVVGNPESLVEESHGTDGLLEYPVYTKPPTWRGLAVPDVLMSGHHGKVARWRRDEALRRTVVRRPDLARGLDPAGLDTHDRAVLDDLGFRPDDGPVAD